MATPPPPKPPWNPAEKSACLMHWGKWMHDEAREIFNKNGSHGKWLFMFDDSGARSAYAVAPNTGPDELVLAVREAVHKHNPFGVITMSEGWVYLPKQWMDHTSRKILDGEMTVSDLRPDDRTEVFMIRLESRAGDCLTWIDPIVRQDGRATLGGGMLVPRERSHKLASYFDGALS